MWALGEDRFAVIAAGHEEMVASFEQRRGRAAGETDGDRRHTARRVCARATALSHGWTRRCHSRPHSDVILPKDAKVITWLARWAASRYSKRRIWWLYANLDNGGRFGSQGHTGGSPKGRDLAGVPREFESVGLSPESFALLLWSCVHSTRIASPSGAPREREAVLPERPHLDRRALDPKEGSGCAALLRLRIAIGHGTGTLVRQPAEVRQPCP